MTGKPTYEELEQGVKKPGKICRGHDKASAREHITERKRADEDRRKSERRYRHLLEGLPDIVWSFSDKRGTIFASGQVEKILGYSPEYLYKSPWLWNQSIHPDDKNDVDKAIKNFAAGKDLDVEYRIKDVSGNWRWFHDRSIDRQIEGDEVIIEGISTDITKRKRAEEALRESEKRYRDLFENSTDFVYTLDLKGNFTDVNKAAEDLTGYRKNELIGMNYKDYTPEDTHERIFKAFNGVFNEGEPLKDFPLEVIIKDGTKRYFETCVSPWRKGEEIIGFQGNSRDITERKLSEETLRESEEKYRSLVESADDSIYLVDRYLKYLFMNKKHLSRCGLSSEEAIGKLYEELHSEGETREFTDRVMKVFETGKSIRYEYCSQRDGGFFLRSISPVKGADGETMAVTVVSKEITGRKHAEDALRESEVRFSTIFHSSPVSIGISRVKDGQLLDVNDAWQKLLGFSREEAIGRNTIKLNAWVNPGDRGRLISRLSEDGTVENFEVQGRHKSGSLIDLLMFARLIDIAGEQYSLILSQDITEKKRLESQVQQRQKMETLGTLVAGVAHEINNPINTIMNNAPLLRGVWKDLLPLVEERAEKEPGCRYGGLTGGFLKENMDQLISDMDMAANRVASIVKGLKDFSRKTSPLEKQQVDINIAVENAIRLAGPTIRKSGITLALDLAPDLPAINANLQNLEQIIMNLAVNAVQAIDHDHGEIKIATTHNKNQGTIVLSVQDNGRGISTAISDKIFDPFFTEWQSIGGTGLGLPITQNLVKANDGEITFKSRMGKGTSFLVSFTVERKKKPFKILLVDDNEAVLEMVKQALTIERHYMVEQARGGNEALIKIGIYHPDLLILDIFMPQMDGVEVCREIQKHPELYDMKVIILTGYPEHDKVKEVAEMGFTNVVPKPLMDLREFMKEVDDLLMGKEEG